MKCVSKILVYLSVLALLLCSSACDSDSAIETVQPVTTPKVTTTEKAEIKWTDYVSSASTNVIKVGFHDKKKDDASGYNLSFLVSTPSENTVGFYAMVMCPYCEREDSVYFDFEDLPQEKLGEKVIILEEQVTCWSWDQHEDSFTSRYPVSVLLTLNK